MEAERTLQTSTTSLNRTTQKSRESMALSTRLSNCSTHWRRRAKKGVAEQCAERCDNFARLAFHSLGQARRLLPSLLNEGRQGARSYRSAQHIARRRPF